MAKNNDVLQTSSDILPVGGVTNIPDQPGTFHALHVDDEGNLQVDIVSGGTGGGTLDQGAPNTAANAWPVKLTDGTDIALVTAAGEVNVLSTAQPGIDIGDVTVNNAAGAAAVNIQDGGNSITVDGSLAISSIIPGTGATNLGKAEDSAAANSDTGVVLLAQRHDATSTTTTGDDRYSTIHVNNQGRLKAVDENLTDGTALVNIFQNGTGTTAEVIQSEPTGTEGGLVTRPIPNATLPQLVSGQVSVALVVPGVSATALGKQEDFPHASSDVGVMDLAVRNDSDVALAGSNLDYIPLSTDATGRLRTITQSVVPGTSATNLGKQEDQPAASGDTLIAIAAQRHDALSSTVDADGDYTTLHVDSLGRLKVTDVDITNGTALFSVYDSNSGAFAEVIPSDVTGSERGLVVRVIPTPNIQQLITGSVSVSGLVPGTGTTSLGKAEDAQHSSGSVGVMPLIVRNDNDTVLAGTDLDYIPPSTDSSGHLRVTVQGMTSLSVREAYPSFSKTFGGSKDYGREMGFSTGLGAELF